MNKLLFAFVFSLLGAAAYSGPEPNPPGMPPNLAVDIQAPGAVRAEIAISIPSLKEAQLYQLESDGGSIKGGVYLPPGEESLVTVQVFDERGELVYKAEGYGLADKEVTPEFRLPLDGAETRLPVYARFGSNLLTAAIAHVGDDPMLQLSLLDPLGNPVQFSPDDLEWKVPEGFPTLPYSCFNNSLCILQWKPTREQEIIYFCWHEKLKGHSCFENTPQDPRRPYMRVAVGLNHTCALTGSGEIFCWGDNQVGQLGSFTPTGCPVSGRVCSAVPVKVLCSAGESCKYKALAAGNNHTCAIDTNGKAWCWGENIEAIGVTPTTSGAAFGTPWHHEVSPQGTLNGFTNLVAIDTNVSHTCAVTAGGDVFCWGTNSNGELAQVTKSIKTTFGLLVNTGNKYKGVATGTKHTCAIQQSGLLDCWGDNVSFQLTGNTNNASVITVTSKVPLLFNHGVAMIAAGETSTCTQNAYDDAICWGSPAAGTGVNASNAGHYLLRPAYTRSIATDRDACGTAACTRSCLTDIGGGLFCGNWRANVLPSQLKEVALPKGVAALSYDQVDVGPSHVCAVTSHNDIYCFGLNTFGQFGTGVISSVRTDEPVAPAAR